ncbi:hypothetical protein [Nocardioides sp.]|uniref:hypothetical protein n=1 Tax=Nocardioides sp. TaxID=35761 RepID=UPI00262BA02D|nr:hypothetical protein [Nocardioides sp.]
MTTDENIAPPEPPTKVCAHCSVQTQTSGEFCPNCGKGYATRRSGLSRKAIALTLGVVLIVCLIATGIALKVRHDRDQADEAVALADRKAEEADALEAQEVADAAEAAQEARQEAKAAAARAERRLRMNLVKQMQGSITKDAKERVADGELEGPIYYTSCDPLGGGSVDDLTALTTTFECIAVNEKLDGGQFRGWVFSATANWDEGSWTWRLGS